MDIDKLVYKLPMAGQAYRRMHAFFKKNITTTDIIHVLIGVGIGIFIANKNSVYSVMLFLSIGVLYHLYAYVKGNPNENM